MTQKTEKWNPGWSRRKFLTRIGMAGGAAALYETMVAMNLINTPPEWNGIPRNIKNGEGKSVLILGAGIGGLTAAYILSQNGYRCEILEATSRAGGRNHTARRGSTVVEKDENGNQTVQECKFDSGLYLNLGPGRLPYHHRRVLGYCQELEVKLEPYIMNTTGNLFQTDHECEDKDSTRKSRPAFDGKPVVYRRLQNDTKGYIAELLAKAVNQGALDKELSKSDRKKLLSLLEVFGPLKSNTLKGKKNYSYEGSTRDGCAPDPLGKATPNVFYDCEVPDKTPLNELLCSEFWENSFYDPVEFEWQPTLFQPIGGMDMIVEGFLRKVGHLVTYNCPVVEIDAQLTEVEVTYLDGAERKTKKADYCISNIPCPILAKIINKFPGEKTKYETQNDLVSFKGAVERTKFSPSCKVGWQCNTRFWENSNYEIYGGISWTDAMIEQIWYPSNDYFSQKGTLTGAYIHEIEVENKIGNATKFGNYSLEKRLKVAKEGGKKLHEEIGDETIVPTELGLSIAWQHVPYLEGAWPFWDENNQHHNRDYERLLRPFRGRFFVVGDQASTLPGWQEGAMMSAEHVVEWIGGFLPLVLPKKVKAPNSIKVTRGLGK